MTSTSIKPKSAGDEIDAWCTKCRLDLGHRIVAMVGRLPKRVVCMTCGSEHNYRAPKTAGTATTKASKTAKTAKPRAASRAASDWESRISGQSLATFTRYSMDQTFKVDQLVTHKKFGEGYVTSLPSPGKVTIAFRDGERTLIHGKD